MQDQQPIIAIDQDIMKNQTDPVHFIQKAHTNSIQSLAVHPSRSHFLTGSHDHSIKLWDAPSFKAITTINQHKQGVWTLNYNNDGSLFASGSPDTSVLLWDSKKNTPSQKLQAHSGKVYSARFNETSTLLGTCGENGEIFVWDLKKTDQPLKKIIAKTLVVYDFVWSQDRSLFFNTTLGSEVLVFDASNYSQLASDFATHNEEMSKCEAIGANFNFIKNRVFIGTSRGTIAWYEYTNSKLNKMTQYRAHMDSVRTISYHPSKTVLLSSGRDGSVKLWDAKDSKHHPLILGNLVGHKENVPAAAWLDQKTVVTGSWDQSLALFNVQQLIQ